MKRSKSAYVMLQTLIALLGLVAVTAALAASEHARFTNIQSRIEGRKANEAANAAIARAESVLDGVSANLVEQTTTDSWSQLGNGSLDSFDMGNNATFRFQIVDAGAMLNVNTATAAQLELLPLSQEQVDCLTDWRTSGTTAASDGAKDDYYNNLTQPYNTKLDLLTTIDELLLVKNWTAQTLYQAPILSPTSTDYPLDTNQAYLPLANFLTVDSGCPNTKADGTARTNFDTTLTVATLTGLGLSAPYTSFARIFAVPNMSTADQQVILNDATFSTSTRLTGKININTAPEGVLMLVPGMTEAAASSIVAYQSTGFTSLGQLATLGGMTQDILAQVADYLGVGGDTWVVRAYGECGGVGAAYEAVIGIRNSKVEIINMNRLNTIGIPKWWNWDSKTTNTYQAGDAGEISS
jgi:DNA uptake protein ComE-like DNA-binding protein